MTTTTPATWVIASILPTMTEPGLSYRYWADDGRDGFDRLIWRDLGPPDDTTGTVRTFPSRKMAETTFRDEGNKLTRRQPSWDNSPGIQAVKLTPEQAASLLPALPAVMDELNSGIADERTRKLDELKEWLADDYEATNPEHIDRLLRDQAREFDHNWAMLIQYIHHARDYAIHKDLGFKSWPDYIADVARTEMPNVARSVEQRRKVVGLLAGEGMSNRAIADAVGVSHPTVIRDRAATEADEVVHDVPPEPLSQVDRERAAIEAAAERRSVTGRDGKTYPCPPEKKARKLTPAEVQARLIGQITLHLYDIGQQADKVWGLGGLDDGIEAGAAASMHHTLIEAIAWLPRFEKFLRERAGDYAPEATPLMQQLIDRIEARQ